MCSGSYANDLWLLRGNATDADQSPSLPCAKTTVTMITVHGILMAIAFGLLLPFGALMMRHFRCIYTHITFQVTENLSPFLLSSPSLFHSLSSLSPSLCFSPPLLKKKKKKKRKKKKKKEFDPLHFAYRANRSVDDVVALGFHYILQALGLSKYMCKSFVDTDIIPQNYVNSW